MNNKTNGNVTKVVAAAAVLCALAACNNSNKAAPTDTTKKQDVTKATGGTNTPAADKGSGCPGSKGLVINDIPGMAHGDKEAQLSMDCTAEISTPGVKAPQCITMEKLQASERGEHGNMNYTWVRASEKDLQAWGFHKLEAALAEDVSKGELSESDSSRFNIERVEQDGSTQVEKTGYELITQIGENPTTFSFDTVDSQGKGGKTATVSHTLTMTCNVTSAAKTPAPEKSGAPAPEKTTTPAPEKTGVPAPQKTGTPAKQAPQKAPQQAPSKGGAQQKQ